MFIGHYALGLAAKRVEPRLSLGVLLAAPQALDLLWPIFVLLGIERVEVAPGDTAFTPLRFVSYPWSHSLVAAAVIATVFALLVRFVGRASPRAAAIVWLLVVSHWLLDFASHRADLPLWPGGPLCGLGLWSSVPATLSVEIAMYAGGIALYVSATRAKDRIGQWTMWGLIAFLFAAYLGNVFGPPPPSATAVAIAALALWLVPVVGIWIDRHREPLHV